MRASTTTIVAVVAATIAIAFHYCTALHTLHHCCCRRRPSSSSNNKIVLVSMSSSTSSTTNDAIVDNVDPFTKLEYTNWQQGVNAYNEGFGPLTIQAVPKLLQAARYPPAINGYDENDSDLGDTFHLLDVACGPGQVLSEAISLSKKTTTTTTTSKTTTKYSFTGLDFSPNFIQLAQQNIMDLHPDVVVASKNVHFVQGDAQDMTQAFDDNTFDCVVCNFGILHLSKPEQFLQEAYRVLKPNGYISYSVWMSPPNTQGFELILNAVNKCGNPSVELPEGPPFFRFANVEETTQALRSVGFTNIETHVVDDMKWTNVKSSEQLFSIFVNGTARTRELLMKQTNEQLIAIQNELKIQFDTLTQNGKIPLKMPVLISSGRKETAI